MLNRLYLALLGEQLARRFIVQGYAVERGPDVPIGWYINLGILALLGTGLVLSLIPARRR